MPNKWRRIISCVAKVDFTVDEGKGRLNPSREKKDGKQRRRKVEKSYVNFLLCDPSWCVHKFDAQNKWDVLVKAPRYQTLRSMSTYSE